MNNEQKMKIVEKIEAKRNENKMSGAKAFSEEFFILKKEENREKLDALINLKETIDGAEWERGRNSHYKQIRLYDSPDVWILLEAIEDEIAKTKVRIDVCDYNLSQVRNGAVELV